MSKYKRVIDLNERFRQWTIVLYPEHISETDLYKYLQDLNIPSCIGPLHHPDEDNKKEHYHLILDFAGKKSGKYVKSLFDPIQGGNAPRPENIDSMEAMYAYLTHKNDPEKEQFPEDIHPLNFCGFRTEQFKPDYEVNKDNLKIILESKADDMKALCEYIMDIGYNDVLSWIMKNSYFVNTLLCAKRGK